jgi:hypothetical protein
MRAKSIREIFPDEIQLSLQDSMTGGFTPTPAIVFLSPNQGRSDQIEKIKKIWNVPMAEMFSNAELARVPVVSLKCIILPPVAGH